MKAGGRTALAAVFFVVSATVPSLPAAAPPPPVNGDWIVNGPEMLENQTLLVNGSLVVTATGQLTLRNVTLLLNSTFDGQWGIRVNASGSLSLEDSLVAAYDPAWTYRFDVLGSASLRGTVVQDLWGIPVYPYPGGIHVSGGALDVQDSTVRRSQSNGLHVVDGQLHARNLTLEEITYFGVYLNRTANATIEDSRFLDPGRGLGAGLWAQQSPGLRVANTQFRGYFGEQVFAERVDGLTVDRCLFMDSQPGSELFVEGSKNVTVTNSSFLNVTAGGGISFTTWGSVGSSARLDNVSMPVGPVYGEAGAVDAWLSPVSVSNSFIAGGMSAAFSRVDVSDSVVGDAVLVGGGSYFDARNVTFESLLLEVSTASTFAVADSVVQAHQGGGIEIYVWNDSYYVATNVTHIPGPPNSIMFDVRDGGHVVLTNYTTDLSRRMFVDFLGYDPANPSDITVRNFVTASTVRHDGPPLPEADARILNDGRVVFATAGFGGADPRTGADGETALVVVTDRVFHRDYSNPPVHYFENITYANTTAEVSLPGVRFADDPRVVNTSTSHVETFLGDGSPPSILSVEARPDPADLGQPVGLQAVVVDDWRVASVRARVVGPSGREWNLTMNETQPSLFETSRTFPDPGVYNAYVTARDVLGWETTAVVPFAYADLSGPLVAGLAADPPAAGPGDPVRVTATVTDNVEVATVRLSVQGPGVADNVTMTGLGSAYEVVLAYSILGRYDLTAWAEDTSGRWSSAAASFSVVDVTPPVTTLVVQGPNVTVGPVLTLGPAARIALLAADDRTGITHTEYALDGGAWQAYASPFPLGAGPHALAYRSVDGAGNTEEVHTALLFVDGLPPVLAVHVEGPASGTVLAPNATVAVSASDAGSGVGSVEVRWDGGAWAAYAAPVPAGSEGAHVLECRATDRVGNTASGAFAYRVDATGPTAVIDALSGTALAPGELAGFSGARSAESAGDAAIASYAWDFGDGSTASGTVVVHPFALPGEYNVSLTVTDVLGRTSTASVRLTVAPPVSPSPELPSWVWAGFLLLAALLFASLLWTLRRRRSSAQRPSSDSDLPEKEKDKEG